MQSIDQDLQALWPNLPTPRTSLIGCEPAIATIRDLLQQTRLLTLTGSGGSGKTRLALATAEASTGDFPDGIAWVELAPLTNPSLVPQTVADALHLREQPRRTFTDLVIDYLCDRRALVVFDNCEHVRDACAELLARLLHMGALTRVLATSREPLGISGERVWLVPMLTLPPANPAPPNPASSNGAPFNPAASNSVQPSGRHAATPWRMAELLQSEAVRLFDARARAVAPAFALTPHNAEAVAQICRLLDGMPLAIELAAARVNILVPQQIVARLNDSVHLLTRGAQAGHARHQTLRAALDWSYDLLPAAEQTFFARLSIFAGTFGVDAVEGICAGDGLAVDDLLDLLANLVEKSLVVAQEPTSVRHPEMRYRLLVPVRHYAAEQLRAAGSEDHWRARHAHWYFDLAVQAASALDGAEQPQWLDRLEMEHDNLRAALAWFAATPDGAAYGLQMSSAIGRFWAIRSYLSEGQQWLESFLQHVAPDTAQQAQVDAWNSLARIAMLQSNFQAGRAHFERALVLGRELEYDDGMETGLNGLGGALWELGDFQQARARLEEAAAYARAAGHLKELARALNNLGLVCMHQGDNAATRDALNACLAINQQLGHKTGIATVLFNLAMLASNDGDFVHARLLYDEALAIDRELGNRTTIADVLNNMGALAVAQGDFADAIRCYSEAAQIYREVGATGDTAYTTTGLGDIAFYQGDDATARTHYAEALALFREAGNQRLIARVLGQLGRIACHARDFATAATLCGEALTIRRTIGHRPGMLFILDQGMTELAVATDQLVIAARIMAAVDRARQTLARPREPIDVRQRDALLAHVREQLGDAALAAAWAEGEAMSLDEVTAYALDTLSPVAVVQARPELRIFALGQARVYRGDRLLTSADWTYAKARELFFYLLTHPGATREQIGLDFWPDASAQQVRKRFSVALAHARNALGRDHEWIILRDGRYRINSAHPYWVDAEEFEAKIRAAAQQRQNGAPPAQIAALLEGAINLYRGDFADEFVEGEWHRGRRAALARAYQEALLTLGSIHFAAERYPLAIAAYQKALAKDPYLEEAHHELIRCYARAGKRSLALRQYETLTASLAELNATPASETQQLVERLRLGEILS